MLLALLSVARAAETTVLVSTFEARSPDGVGLAAIVETFLADELKHHDELQVLRVDDLPPYEDYSARVYMEGCPPGDIEGCTLVMGARGHAEWAVTGEVEARDGGSRVTVHVVDVAGSRTVVSFTVDLAEGGDQTFAQGVAKVLAAAIDGAFAEQDLRDLDEEEQTQDLDAVTRQLETLSAELGAVSVTRGNELIERPKYTLEDLAAKAAAEGRTPWDRLGMSAGEYLRYKNSGLRLFEWRERAMGRAGQLIVRPWGGLAWGPFEGEYYGRYAQNETLQFVDTLSEQALLTSRAPQGGATFAWGLTPTLDVGVVIGVAGGAYSVDIDGGMVDQPQGAKEPDRYQEGTVLFGPRVTFSPLPVRAVRPVVGGGLRMGRGPGVSDKVQPPAPLQSWPSPWLVFAEGFVGAEARLAERVDAYAVVPMGAVVSGELGSRARDGTQQVVTDRQADVASPVMTGIEVGLQIRVGGRAPRETSRAEEIGEDVVP